MIERAAELKAIKKRRPYIQMARVPICSVTNYNDSEFVESDTPVYEAFLADGILKIQFIVRWNASQVGLSNREFEVLRFNIIRIDGVDPEVEHIDKPSEALSIHPAIVHAMFDKYLAPYGIELQKVMMYNYRDFDCTEFTFTDLAKKEALCDYIEETLKKKL